ncbi:MAG: YqeG family HAD IIIA-type phosphatase [Clostridia bacterium]|nr:YqeG family HAD IIIA-type phosphatase [Clostridia bacterium]
MGKTRKLRPDIAFYDVYSITPDVLAELGVKGVVFDIDNTIAPYEVETPTEKMRGFFDALKGAGIKMAFVSNNKGNRVMKFNEGLGLFYVCKAGKPSPKGVRKCIEYFGLSKDEVIAVGDQIFTDCLSAHRAGIRFALVKPIKKQETRFFRIKRFFERPFVRGLDWLAGKEALKKIRFKKRKNDNDDKKQVNSDER